MAVFDHFSNPPDATHIHVFIFIVPLSPPRPMSCLSTPPPVPTTYLAFGERVKVAVGGTEALGAVFGRGVEPLPVSIGGVELDRIEGPNQYQSSVITRDSHSDAVVFLRVVVIISNNDYTDQKITWSTTPTFENAHARLRMVQQDPPGVHRPGEAEANGVQVRADPEVVGPPEQVPPRGAVRRVLPLLDGPLRRGRHVVEACVFYGWVVGRWVGGGWIHPRGGGIFGLHLNTLDEARPLRERRGASSSSGLALGGGGAAQRSVLRLRRRPDEEPRPRGFGGGGARFHRCRAEAGEEAAEEEGGGQQAGARGGPLARGGGGEGGRGGRRRRRRRRRESAA